MTRPGNPHALRRVGRSIHIVVDKEEHTAAIGDAARRGISLTNHILDCMRRWRLEDILRNNGASPRRVSKAISTRIP